jgi:hypothetical protein
MNKQQFDALARVLDIEEALREAAYAAMLTNARCDAPELAQAVEQIRAADAAIRAAYIVHSPMEFRVTVGHRDTHRMPGTLQLKLDEVVRLVAQSTERWIPVRVTALPTTPADYYRGVIVQQLVDGSRYQVGNGVMFSEDQVVIEASRASSRSSRRRPRTV